MSMMKQLVQAKIDVKEGEMLSTPQTIAIIV